MKVFMRSITLLFLFSHFTGYCVSDRPIYIEKQGGHRCSWFSSAICFDRVIIKDTDEEFSQRCLGSGRNMCPKIGLFTIGGSSIAVDSVVVQVEKAIADGQLSGTLILEGPTGPFAHVTYDGKINAEGVPDFRLTIRGI